MTTRTALVLSADPYLAFLLERHPEGLAITVGDDRMRVAAILSAAADVIVCEHDDPRRAELVAAVGSRVVTIAPQGHRADRGARVVTRPLAAEQVLRAVDEVEPRQPTLDEDPIGALDRAYPALLAGAGAFAAALFALRGDGVEGIAAGTVVALYGLTRTRLDLRLLWLVDALLAAGVAVAYDGTRGPFVLVGLVVAAGLGLRQRPLLAVPLAFGVGLANVVGTALGRADAALDAAVAVQTVLLATLVAALSGVGTVYARTFEGSEDDHLAQVLHELQGLARSEPEALQLTAVARLRLSRVCEAAAVDRGVLLFREEDALRVAAAHDVEIAPGNTIPLPERLVSASDLVVIDAPELAGTLDPVVGPDESCTCVPVRSHDRVRGWVVLGGLVPRHRRRQVLREAAHAGTAIDNARVFARLQTDTADEQRRRIAGELHDSTAQILTHLRLELELLARSGEVSAPEVDRLARVAGRAQLGVREVIEGLRASLHDEGLAGALRSYVADMQSQSGTSLLFRATTYQQLDADIAHEVFRIAQEAISNAVHHARADVIEVLLEGSDRGVRLAVVDDGTGFDVPASSGAGLGLQQMRDRAERLGGELRIRTGASGTEVALTVPDVQPSGRPENAVERPQRV